MTVKPLSAIFLGAWLCAASAAWAQSAAEEPEWTESEAPPPPAFDVGKLVTIEVSPNSVLVYGVDPASISISKSDGLVRYVMVASSASGARNVMYEAIHCATGEFKTYGRYSPDGHWTMVDPMLWPASILGSASFVRMIGSYPFPDSKADFPKCSSRSVITVEIASISLLRGEVPLNSRIGFRSVSSVAGWSR